MPEQNESDMKMFHDVVTSAIKLISERHVFNKKLDALRKFHMSITVLDPDGTCIADSGECWICSILDCPYNDPLHYRHDGCPSEWLEEEVYGEDELLEDTLYVDSAYKEEEKTNES